MRKYHNGLSGLVGKRVQHPTLGVGEVIVDNGYQVKVRFGKWSTWMRPDGLVVTQQKTTSGYVKEKKQ